MIVDLNAAESWPFAARHQVCVCGSGPAGMTVARELAARGVRVLLLEAGGFELTGESQDVYDGKSVGPLDYSGITACRLRMFGGTSNHWAGRCGVLEKLDFEARDIWDVPGWPISWDEAYARLDDAREILDVADQPLIRGKEPHWRSERFAPSAFARSAPTRFGEKYRAELEASTKIDVAINANVVSAKLSPNGGAIIALKVADYKGRTHQVVADHYVIAFGALENARFLLNLAEASGAPVGNQGDFVGRCFMEHFNTNLGRFIAFDLPLWDRDTPISVNADDNIARAQKLGTAVVTLTPGAKPRFYGRLAPLRRMRNEIACGAHRATGSGEGNRTILCAGDGTVSNILEQTPNRDSRVTLDRTAKDRFGNYRIAVDWRMSAQDHHTIKGLAVEIGKALAAQNVARFQIDSDILDGDPKPGFHCHQMGTTRMSASARDGVVDRDLKVHGMENLHIAGSSVFSTGGGVNPTLTLTALALRLGEHIATKLVRT